MYANNKVVSVVASVTVLGLVFCGSGCGSKNKGRSDSAALINAPVRPVENNDNRFAPRQYDDQGTPRDEYAFLKDRQPGSSEPLPSIRVEPVQITQPVTTEAPVNNNMPQTQLSGNSYTMQKGDTLYAVARKFNVPPQKLIAANNFSNPNQVRVGEKVIIPQ